MSRLSRTLPGSSNGPAREMARPSSSAWGAKQGSWPISCPTMSVSPQKVIDLEDLAEAVAESGATEAADPGDARGGV